MDSLQKQVIVLNSKVDALQQISEQLSGKVSQVLSELKTATASSGTNQSYSGPTFSQFTYQRSSMLNTAMEHKDVIADSNYPQDEQTGEQELAPDIQIRRLTAQLTAAYNRIAALEEQLLAQRIH